MPRRNEEGAPRRWRDHPLLKRLPIFLVAAAGIFVWQGGGGLFPVERQLVWRLPAARQDIRAVEIQVWDGDELLKREERAFARGAEPEIVQTLPLKKGEYAAKVFIRREGQERSDTWAQPLRVGGEETIVTSLR